VGGGELSSEDSSDEISIFGRSTRLVSALLGVSGGVEIGELESETKGRLVCIVKCSGASSILCSMVGS
jgi:hypothetical protein